MLHQTSKVVELAPCPTGCCVRPRLVLPSLQLVDRDSEAALIEPARRQSSSRKAARPAPPPLQASVHPRLTSIPRCSASGRELVAEDSAAAASCAACDSFSDTYRRLVAMAAAARWPTAAPQPLLLLEVLSTGQVLWCCASTKSQQLGTPAGGSEEQAAGRRVSGGSGGGRGPSNRS